MKRLLTVILTILILILTSVSSYPDWLIYHKPAFRGKVIDAETKEPIEEAVVVAIYVKWVLGFEPQTSYVDIKEVLTDKNGEFHIPSYTTVIQPFSWEAWVRFIIFKPGYGSYPDYRLGTSKQLPSFPSREEFFTGALGEEGEIIERDMPWKKYKVTFGVVELPKLKTREDFERRMLGFPTGFGAKELPHLYKAYEEEKKIYDIGK